METVAKKAGKLKDFPISTEDIINDYRTGYRSRQASLLGRKEVLTGKAKFGIFGDGKEVAQLAMARSFRKGDFRSGYYRDQTFMFALGISSVREFFAQLYANPSVEFEPSSAGRSMNGHFATRSLNPDGSWKELTAQYNSSADISPTASQMPRLVGLAQASRFYRELEILHHLKEFSNQGNEIAYGTIGNASCAEGMFWESVNAIGVLRSPAIISIWDDGYGISVPNHLQVTKNNVGELLKGFQREKGTRDGYDIYTVKGWDYPALLETYLKASEITRTEHVPAIIHVIEVTQPQGHSTSGSHERYKSKERLQWEKDFDGLLKMREWMIANGISTTEEMDAWEAQDKQWVLDEKKAAFNDYYSPIKEEIAFVIRTIDELAAESGKAEILNSIKNHLTSAIDPVRKEILETVRKVLMAVSDPTLPSVQKLISWKKQQDTLNFDRYSSYLHSETHERALNVTEIPATYSDESPVMNGFEILNRCFDAILTRDPRVVAFGEDVGHIGDVNQAFAGLQSKHGLLRVSDTGIRECTILGQAIGLAMRGLRPIAEIQYLDYLLYALQLMSDDLSTVQYRTKGGQKAPAIIRTRGHRLEGIWHSGSPMAGIINLVRGMHVCVPRNMTQAAGFYNTLLKSDEPGLIIEVLNGYRLKERLPDNIDTFTVALGKPEILREGTDVTVVSYGATLRIVQQAAETLAQHGISIEVIDVQTLLPFDLYGVIVESLKKTNRILFVDEDVPGGATAYMMQEVIEKQNGYFWLDSPPRTLTARAHRPAYGSDGDYFSKPSAEDIFDAVYELMAEAEPGRFTKWW